MLMTGTAFGDHGEKVFMQVCSVCHGVKGQGTPGLAPPLRGSSFVQSTEVQALADFIQKGRSGSEKKFPELPSPMPPYNGGSEKALHVAIYVKTRLQE